jgi:hypothetical protein
MKQCSVAFVLNVLFFLYELVQNTLKVMQCSEEFEDSSIHKSNLVTKHFNEENAVCGEALRAIPGGANHEASSPRSSSRFLS